MSVSNAGLETKGSQQILTLTKKTSLWGEIGTAILVLIKTGTTTSSFPNRSPLSVFFQSVPAAFSDCALKKYRHTKDKVRAYARMKQTSSDGIHIKIFEIRSSCALWVYLLLNVWKKQRLEGSKFSAVRCLRTVPPFWRMLLQQGSMYTFNLSEYMNSSFWYCLTSDATKVDTRSNGIGLQNIHLVEFNWYQVHRAGGVGFAVCW